MLIINALRRLKAAVTETTKAESNGGSEKKAREEARATKEVLKLALGRSPSRDELTLANDI
jgi:hypothetical protein